MEVIIQQPGPDLERGGSTARLGGGGGLGGGGDVGGGVGPLACGGLPLVLLSHRKLGKNVFLFG